METIAQALAALLATRGPSGGLLYSQHDRTVAIALLAAIEGSPWSVLGRAAARVHRLYRDADLQPEDSAEISQAKLTTYLERHPVHPSLLREIAAVLARAGCRSSAFDTGSRLGRAWARIAVTERDRKQARGAVLGFMIDRLQENK